MHWFNLLDCNRAPNSDLIRPMRHWPDETDPHHIQLPAQLICSFTSCMCFKTNTFYYEGMVILRHCIGGIVCVTCSPKLVEGESSENWIWRHVLFCEEQIQFINLTNIIIKLLTSLKGMLVSEQHHLYLWIDV